MRSSVLLLSVLSLASSVVAQDVDASDIPTQCKDVCAPVVSLTASCDKKTSDDDNAERNCVCKDSRAAKSIPVCAACLTKHGKDGSDNDANDLVRSCSLTTTSFGLVTTTSTMSGSSATTTGGAGAMTSGTTTSSTTSESTSGMSSMSSAGSASSTPPASTSNAANGPMLPGTSIIGAVFAGLMALV